MFRPILRDVPYELRVYIAKQKNYYYYDNNFQFNKKNK